MKHEAENNPPLILKVFKNQNHLSPTVFHFIISLEISKRATKRNRLRRILREWARTNLENIKKGYKILVVLKPGAIQLKSPQLRRAFLEELKKDKVFIT